MLPSVGSLQPFFVSMWSSKCGLAVHNRGCTVRMQTTCTGKHLCQCCVVKEITALRCLVMSHKSFNEAILSASVNIVFAGCRMCVIIAMSISSTVQTHTAGYQAQTAQRKYSFCVCVCLCVCAGRFRCPIMLGLRLKHVSAAWVRASQRKSNKLSEQEGRVSWCVQCPEGPVPSVPQCLWSDAASRLLSGPNCESASPWPAATAETRTRSKQEKVQGGFPCSKRYSSFNKNVWAFFLQNNDTLSSSDLFCLCTRLITFLVFHFLLKTSPSLSMGHSCFSQDTKQTFHILYTLLDQSNCQYTNAMASGQSQVTEITLHTT